ncbi:MAG: AAA family ATPase [Patescibacteria group bacterium]
MKFRAKQRVKDWSNIEITEEFQKIFDLLNNTRENVFVTGRAGTGKSTLLEYFRTHTAKNLVVLAPTGVAAVNVRGQTIHSFFGFHPNITPEKIHKVGGSKKKNRSIYEKIETIVIDEISMVRADLLDCVDKFMRVNGANANLPFGGAQMIFFGDLYQLPPVVQSADRKIFHSQYDSPYFFSARVFASQGFLKSSFQIKIFELEKIYRQKDDKFIDILNKVRENNLTDQDLQILNSRHEPNYFPNKNDLAIYLTSTNALADSINFNRLNKLENDELFFTGQVSGKFTERHLPTELNLKLKIGAQVMLLRNDPEGAYYNGSIGRVAEVILREFETGQMMEEIVVELNSGDFVSVLPNTWDLYEYYFDSSNGWIESKSVGSFVQYPLKLAWAITIHKSQGKTFENLVIDVGAGTFAHGQMYVALSRATCLSGIILKRKIEKRHIIMDDKIVEYFKRER